MRRVILESPLAGDVKRNLVFLEEAIRDSIGRGEAPFASHRMYVGLLDEATQRDLGIAAGFAWWEAADAIVFYLDLGMSPGMQKAYDRAKELGCQIELRKIHDNLRHK